MGSSPSRKLIAVDCDGTFFNTDGYPSADTRAVVQKLTDAGHLIVAVTGRSRLTACERLASVPGMRHIVCSNGAYAWDNVDNCLLWSTEITRSQVTDIVSRLRSGLPDATFGWESTGGIGFEELFVKLAGGINELEIGGDSGDPWSQSLYKLKVRRAAEFQADLLPEVIALLTDTPCEITTSGAPFVEITAPGSHKGSGLERTAASLGVPAANTIVFGDHHNDIPMFRWAGHAVAMENAQEAVHRVAHDRTLRNSEHGVARYLEKLFESGVL